MSRSRTGCTVAPAVRGDFVAILLRNIIARVNSENICLHPLRVEMNKLAELYLWIQERGHKLMDKGCGEGKMNDMICKHESMTIR